MSEITFSDAGMTPDQREQAFREFHADQLRQQTKHLFTIQAILSAWFVLFIIAALVYVIAAFASSSSGY